MVFTVLLFRLVYFTIEALSVFCILDPWGVLDLFQDYTTGSFLTVVLGVGWVFVLVGFITYLAVPLVFAAPVPLAYGALLTLFSNS